jgi:hypothetical protein
MYIPYKACQDQSLNRVHRKIASPWVIISEIPYTRKLLSTRATPKIWSCIMFSLMAAEFIATVRPLRCLPYWLLLPVHSINLPLSLRHVFRIVSEKLAAPPDVAIAVGASEGWCRHYFRTSEPLLYISSCSLEVPYLLIYFSPLIDYRNTCDLSPEYHWRPAPPSAQRRPRNQGSTPTIQGWRT